jgi:hypothetical protein
MHRTDAATVSYTEVTVSSPQASMRYHAGAPCQTCECSFVINLRISQEADRKALIVKQKLWASSTV